MSAGLFGSYFRRSKQGEDGEGAPVSAEPVREGNAGGAPPGASRAPSADAAAELEALLRQSGAAPQEKPQAQAPAANGKTPAQPPQSDDVNYRLSQVINALGDEDGAAEQPAPAAQPAAGKRAAAPSPLDELTHDKVIVGLLQEGLIAMPQALIALREHKQHPEKTLWRIAAELSGVDRDAVFEAAARLQGFELAKLSEGNPSDELVEAVCALFPPEVTLEMFDLGLFPFAFVMDAEAQRHTMVLATHDPSHPAAAAFAAKLSLEVELRYAKKEIVSGRIRRLLEDRMEAEAQAGAAPAHVPPEGGSPPPQEGLSADEIVHMIQGDVVPDQHTVVEDRIEPAHPELQGGDGYIDAVPPEVAAPPQPEAPPEPEPEPAPPRTEAPVKSEPEPAPETEPEPEPEPAVEPEPVAEAEPVEAEPAVEEEEEGSSLTAEDIKSKDRVVTMLLRKGIVTPKQVHEAQERQRKENIKDTLWRILTQSPKVDRDAVFAEAATLYAFPTVKLAPGKPDPDFARSVVETFPEKLREELFTLRVLPFECDLESKTGAIKLVFVTHDPTRPEVNRLMQQLKLERFELRYAPEALVKAAMAEAFPKKNEFLERMNEGSMAMDLGASFDEKSQLIDEDQLEAEIGRSALINLFEATLVEAVRQGASDIHIWPNAKKKIEIHFRVDGRLSHWHTEDKVHPEAFLAVIKDNSTNVDRFERDAAQDGFIQRWIDDALIRFRVSILPIANASAELHSESIVIRVLDDRKVLTDLSKLGLLKGALEKFHNAIRQPHGMVILTGPTGSGKSTTLVAALHQVVSPEVNVLTVEDPVEYIIPGVRQIKLNHKLGLEEALRSILRHDPDVVMVGEMRDRHTAELAIKLANTGHLTFSTLHTNDAPAAVSRLYKMGVEPFLIGYAINLVVAQRLIRGLCPDCKKVEKDPDPVMMKRLGFTPEEINGGLTIYMEGKDPKCSTCKGVGYKGRRAICEALYFSREIRHLIVEAGGSIDEGAIRDQAVKEGMLTLADSAREIVKMGDTSLQEMIRVVMSES